MKESIIKDAKVKAIEEAQKIVTTATAEIENQKKAAIVELKNQTGKIAVDIAEKLVKKELKSNADHMQFVQQLVSDIKMN
jgi:F-type H+-transporting ATPase subunit b